MQMVEQKHTNCFKIRHQMSRRNREHKIEQNLKGGFGNADAFNARLRVFVP